MRSPTSSVIGLRMRAQIADDFHSTADPVLPAQLLAECFGAAAHVSVMNDAVQCCCERFDGELLLRDRRGSNAKLVNNPAPEWLIGDERHDHGWLARAQTGGSRARAAVMNHC